MLIAAPDSSLPRESLGSKRAVEVRSDGDTHLGIRNRACLSKAASLALNTMSTRD